MRQGGVPIPTKDLYHSLVRQALVQEGWTITHDPLLLKWGSRNLFIDLGAESVLAAERGSQKIAVEIKSFLSDSTLADLHAAIGQYTVYHDILEELEPERILYLALPLWSYQSLFEEGQIGEVLLKKRRVRLIVFDSERETIVKWIP